MAAKEFTGDELASSGFIAFQGGVYDLADFAVGHPGGADLITEWTGKDGTDSLLDAHPGGKAFIKHTLGPKGFATALKGASPRSTLCDIHPPHIHSHCPTPTPPRLALTHTPNHAPFAGTFPYVKKKRAPKAKAPKDKRGATGQGLLDSIPGRLVAAVAVVAVGIGGLISAKDAAVFQTRPSWLPHDWPTR